MGESIIVLFGLHCLATIEVDTRVATSAYREMRRESGPRMCQTNN